MMQIFYWLKGNFEEEINYKKSNRSSAVIKFPEPMQWSRITGYQRGNQKP
jgi:hypothetical protein